MVRASGNAPEPGTDLVRCGEQGRRLSLSYARMNDPIVINIGRMRMACTFVSFLYDRR